MPTVDQIEDKNGNVFDIEDASAQTKIGDLTELKTESKSNLVSALNETLTPSQIETITVPLGTVKFCKIGRLVMVDVSIRLPQNPGNPLTIAEDIDDKYLPIILNRTPIFDNTNDTTCGQCLIKPVSKIIEMWFSRDYQLVEDTNCIFQSLYIAKS